VHRVNQALHEVSDGSEPTIAMQEIVAGLSSCLRSLVVFRGRHYRIANEAYNEENRLFELGSGGGSVQLLGHILDLTKQNSNLIRRQASLRTDDVNLESVAAP